MKTNLWSLNEENENKFMVQGSKKRGRYNKREYGSYVRIKPGSDLMFNQYISMLNLSRTWIIEHET